MANPFANVLSSDTRDLYNNMVDAMLQPTPLGLAVPCSLVTIGTKYEAHTDQTAPSNFPPGRNFAGSPVRFPSSRDGLVYSDQKLKPVEFKKTVYLVPVWNYREWVGIDIRAGKPDADVQTISAMTTLPDIKRSTYAVINTDIENYRSHKFELAGEPEPAGLQSDRYIFTLWRKL